MEASTEFETASPSRSYQRDVSALRILIVDDEESILWALSQNLSLINDNFVIGTATSAEEALSILSTSTVDVLITDLRLPKMDGLTLIAETQRLAPDTRAILMTAYGNAELARTAHEHNVSAYIEKPFSIEVLIRALDLADEDFQDEDEEETSPLPSPNDDASPIRPAFRDASSWNRARSLPLDQVLRPQQLERKPPKLIRDFSSDELQLQPEPELQAKVERSDPAPILDNLVLLAEEDLEATNLEPAERRERAHQLVAQGVGKFKGYDLEAARVLWLRALHVDPENTEANRNLKILEKVLKARTC